MNNARLERRFRNIGVDVRERNETIGTLRTQIRDKGYIIEYLQKSLGNVTDERDWLPDTDADMENETVSFFNEDQSNFPQSLDSAFNNCLSCIAVGAIC